MCVDLIFERPVRNKPAETIFNLDSDMRVIRAPHAFYAQDANDYEECYVEPTGEHVFRTVQQTAGRLSPSPQQNPPFPGAPLWWPGEWGDPLKIPHATRKSLTENLYVEFWLRIRAFGGALMSLRCASKIPKL